jgi:hypothetical protein
MKTKNNIITKSIAGTLPIALLAVGLTLGPWTASAWAHGGGGSFGGHGGGGGSFGRGGRSFTPSMQGHSGAAFGARQPNFAPAMRERETQSSFAPAARAPTTVHERTMTVPNDVNRRAAFTRIDSRMARLNARVPAGEDVWRHHDHIARTRERLFELVDFGTPDWEIDAWMDALSQDEIIDGMPSDLVLDYWGNPIVTEGVVLDGAPASVWTYHRQPGRTDRITVARGAVRSVRHA